MRGPVTRTLSCHCRIESLSSAFLHREDPPKVSRNLALLVKTLGGSKKRVLVIRKHGVDGLCPSL